MVILHLDIILKDGNGIIGNYDDVCRLEEDFLLDVHKMCSESSYPFSDLFIVTFDHIVQNCSYLGAIC